MKTPSIVTHSCHPPPLMETIFCFVCVLWSTPQNIVVLVMGSREWEVVILELRGDNSWVHWIVNLHKLVQVQNGETNVGQYLFPLMEIDLWAAFILAEKCFPKTDTVLNSS